MNPLLAAALISAAKKEPGPPGGGGGEFNGHPSLGSGLAHLWRGESLDGGNNLVDEVGAVNLMGEDPGPLSFASGGAPDGLSDCMLWNGTNNRYFWADLGISGAGSWTIAFWYRTEADQSNGTITFGPKNTTLGNNFGHFASGNGKSMCEVFFNGNNTTLRDNVDTISNWIMAFDKFTVAPNGANWDYTHNMGIYVGVSGPKYTASQNILNSTSGWDPDITVGRGFGAWTAYNANPSAALMKIWQPAIWNRLLTNSELDDYNTATRY